MAAEFTTLDQAVNYARGLLEDIDVMSDPQGCFHAIRPFGTKHWMLHGYRLVAVVRIQAHVTVIGEIVKEVQSD